MRYDDEKRNEKWMVVGGVIMLLSGFLVGLWLGEQRAAAHDPTPREFGSARSHLMFQVGNCRVYRFGGQYDHTILVGYGCDVEVIDP